jgi:dTDP-4-dehydrorhamnose 3,5-epimerase
MSMRFTDTTIPGVFIVDGEVFADERGTFTIAWRAEDFEAHGLEAQLRQCQLSSNRLRGTIRGLHYQLAPFAQAKVVRATRGAVFDVAVDLRPESPTFRRWVGIELSADNRRAMYVPSGLAHGYQALTDDTEVFYTVSAGYSPAHERGVRWNDPAFGIGWPLGAPSTISARDANYPDFTGAAPLPR